MYVQYYNSFLKCPIFVEYQGYGRFSPANLQKDGTLFEVSITRQKNYCKGRADIRGNFFFGLVFRPALLHVTNRPLYIVYASKCLLTKSLLVKNLPTNIYTPKLFIHKTSTHKMSTHKKSARKKIYPQIYRYTPKSSTHKMSTH